MTVSGQARGNDKYGTPNGIHQVSLLSVKVGDITPYQPGGLGYTDEDGYVTGRSPSESAPSNCTWVFKWAYNFTNNPNTGLYPVNASFTWNVYWYDVPGYYWFAGQAQDLPGATWIFWSKILGAYHCM